MKISVVIPVYNGEKYLAKTLESVFAQTYPAHEIIVVDDGSTDGTAEILKSYEDRIIVRRIPQSGGPSTPKNTGMKMATGDAVAFLDHDDIWFKNKLQRQVEIFEKYPDVDLVACNYAVRYGHLGRRIANHFKHLRNYSRMNFDAPLKAHPFLLLLRENYIGTTSTVVLKKSLIEKVGFFKTGLRICEDYLYWFQCALSTNFVLCEDILMYKRTHTTNISADVFTMFLLHLQALTTAGLIGRDLIEKEKCQPIYDAAIADCNFMLGDLSFEMNKKAQAFTYYFRGLAASLSPSGFGNFLWRSFKKTVRIVTFGRFSRRRTKRFLRS